MKNRKVALKFLFISVFFLSYLVYLYWRAAYTLPWGYGILSVIFGLYLMIAESVGFIETGIFYTTIWKTQTPVTPDVGDVAYPEVDVLIATYNEPSDVLYKTIIGCKNMDYPQKEKVHIIICDDGRRKEIAQLCRSLNVNYITRLDNSYAKAGNLNNALSRTHSPYIVTFDADMIPRHNFLTETIPFFLTGEKIGFVQTPQNFYNPDTFQYNLYTEKTVPNEQDLFSHLIQAGKNRFNAVIYAGSNTVISRQAIADIGGIIVDTITEDFATGMKIQSKGYKCIYLNEILASGLSPERLEDLYNQRIRWGRGVVQTFKKYSPLTQKGLNIMQKIMYFSAFSYWYFGIWRFIFLLAPILFSVFNIIVLSAQPLQVLEIWLPMFLFTNVAYKLFTKNLRTTTWSHIYDTLLFPQVTLGVLLESSGIKLSKFKVTPKDSVLRSSFVNKFRLVRLQIILALLSVAGIIRLVYLSATGRFQTSFIINLIWLVYNLYLLIMSVFFASERPKFRLKERLTIKTQANIKVNGIQHSGLTENISEDGVAVLFEKPFYVEPDSLYELEITTDRYHAVCEAKIIRIMNIDGGKDIYKYRYSFELAVNEANYQQLIGVIYDRIPQAPQFTLHNNVFNILKVNLSQRLQSYSIINHQLPRIVIDRELKAFFNERPVTVMMKNFDYLYCGVESPVQYPTLNIQLNDKTNAVLNCTLNKELSKDNYCVYSINNFLDYANSYIPDLIGA